ncbi:MAG: hypothetical protein ACE5LH_00190 [Fidelibacterota bacterium]
MRRLRLPLFILTALLALVSCEPPVQSVEETDPISGVNFTYLQDVGKIFVSARVKDPFNGVKLNFVQLLWYGTDGFASDRVDSLFLNDNGDFGDILRGDRTYSRKFPAAALKNALAYGDTGSVFLQITAMYLDSTVHALADSFRLGNIVPRIESVDAPDTLELPVTGAKTDTIRATVTDADSLADIKWVGFTSLKPDGTLANNGNPIFLYDDGGEVILYEPNITSGDSAAGDGIYSYVLFIDPTVPAGQYVWTFQAQDMSNAYSNTVVHTLVVE